MTRKGPQEESVLHLVQSQLSRIPRAHLSSSFQRNDKVTEKHVPQVNYDIVENVVNYRPEWV